MLTLPLDGFLPGWPTSNDFSLPLFLLICLGLPLAVLALFWFFSLAGHRHRNPELDARTQGYDVDRAALGQRSNSFADEVSDMADRDESTPDGPNRVRAQRAVEHESDAEIRTETEAAERAKHA